MLKGRNVQQCFFFLQPESSKFERQSAHFEQDSTGGCCKCKLQTCLVISFISKCVSQDVEVLMTALSSHPAQVLEELRLGYNSIGDKSIEYIAEYIKVCNIPLNIHHDDTALLLLCF